MGFQDFGDLHFHGEAGVQAGHGILENHRHIFANDLALLLLAHGLQIHAVEAQRFGADVGSRGQQAHQSHHGDRFA